MASRRRCARAQHRNAVAALDRGDAARGEGCERARACPSCSTRSARERRGCGPRRRSASSTRRKPCRTRPTGSSTTGTPARFAAFATSGIASIQCSDSVPMLSTSAPATDAISSTSSTACARKRTERKRCVRHLVHDDVVRDLVDDRASAPKSLRGRRPFSSKRFAPISTRPFREGRLPKRVRGRAGGVLEGHALCEQRCERGECVHPARVSLRRHVVQPRSRWCTPSKRWSTASSPWPPVRVAAASAELVEDPLGELRAAGTPRASAASMRFSVPTVASGKSRSTSDSTASSWRSFAPEIATSSGSTNQRNAMHGEELRRARFDQIA